MSTIKYREIASKLKINKHVLDDELEVQAQIAFEISEELTDAADKMSLCRNTLEKAEADLYITLKKEYANSTRKVTETELKAMVVLEPEYGAVFARYLSAQREHGEWEGLHESWKSRGFALKSLADLAMANYYEVDTAYREDRKKIADAIQKRPPFRRRTTE